MVPFLMAAEPLQGEGGNPWGGAGTCRVPWGCGCPPPTGSRARPSVISKVLQTLRPPKELSPGKVNGLEPRKWVEDVRLYSATPVQKLWQAVFPRCLGWCPGPSPSGGASP